MNDMLSEYFVGWPNVHSSKFFAAVVCFIRIHSCFSMTNEAKDATQCVVNEAINQRICFLSFSSFKRSVRTQCHRHKVTNETILRAYVSMHQTNSGKSPKFVFPPTFIFCSPICSNNCGVVFL